MFPMRIKIQSRNNEWRCCFCLHVRTATILLGVYHLMLCVLALSILALIMRSHYNAFDKGMANMNSDMDILPTPLSKTKNEDNPYFLPTTQNGNRTIHPVDLDMNALMTICTLAITLLMIYGAVKGKATHLLPYFCLQLFDFAITTLSATGYFCYLRSVHNFVNEHWQNLPYRQELLQLSPQSLSLIVVAVFFFSMLWKAYCISIVWRCYKFLTLRQQATRTTVHYILPGDTSDRLPEPDYSSLLPDYDSACASAMKQPPPPSYQAAMEAQLPPYLETVHVIASEPTLFNFPQPTESTTVVHDDGEEAAAVASNVVIEEDASNNKEDIVEEQEVPNKKNEHDDNVARVVVVSGDENEEEKKQ